MEKNNWLTPNFYQGDYTFIVLPDTQNIVERNHNVYYQMMEWIKNNQNKLNIKAVLHMGDVVNRNTDDQWEVAKKGFDIIDKENIPFMPMLGNHDDTIYFNKYFDYQSYGIKKSYFGGSFEINKLDNTYWHVTVGNRKYIIITLEFGSSNEVIEWAKIIIDNNKDKNIIFTTHACMHRHNRLLLANDSFSITSYEGYENNLEGYEIWGIFSKNDNVILGMSGHISHFDLSKYTINYNNIEKTNLLFDNQDYDKIEQLGMIGILTFSNVSNKVGVNWYSVKLDKLYKEENQFYINVNHLENGE